MKYYFSMANGFQTDALNSILPDAIEITAKQHEELLNGQSMGKTIAIDPDNRPMLQNPPTAALSEIRQLKLDELNRGFESRVSVLKQSYSLSEIHTWDKQEAEARSYLLDSTIQTPLLSALAAARGISLDDLVNKVIIKSDHFATAVGTLIGIRQKLEKELITSTTVEEFDPIIFKLTSIIIADNELTK